MSGHRMMRILYWVVLALFICQMGMSATGNAIAEQINHRISIQFDANGGTVYAGNVYWVSSSDGTYSFRFPQAYWLANAAQTQYEFLGWYTCADGGIRVEEGDHLVTMEDHVLYAHWKIRPAPTLSQGTVSTTVRVSFDPNGGKYSWLNTKAVVPGKEYGSLPSAPIRRGYEFVGWYTSLTGGTKIEKTTIVQTKQDHTLYARWRSLSANQGTSEGSVTRSSGYSQTNTQVYRLGSI